MRAQKRCLAPITTRSVTYDCDHTLRGAVRRSTHGDTTVAHSSSLSSLSFAIFVSLNSLLLLSLSLEALHHFNNALALQAPTAAGSSGQFESLAKSSSQPHTRKATSTQGLTIPVSLNDLLPDIDQRCLNLSPSGYLKTASLYLS